MERASQEEEKEEKIMNIENICTRTPLSVQLSGTSWVTVKEFSGCANIYEILANVPDLTSATNIILGIFDPDYQADGGERWNSGNVPENAITDIGLDRIIVSGSLLRIKADAAASEVIDLVLYLTGM